MTGLLFAAVAAVAAQLTESARSATGIAVAVLGAAYLLRAVGDTGPTWLSWISPIGWAMRVRAFAAEQWWVLVALVGLAVVLGDRVSGPRGASGPGRRAAAATPRPGSQAPPGLRSTFALAWRLHRGFWSAGWSA